MTTTQQISHLYWRAGFGLSPREWHNAQRSSLEDTVRNIFNRKLETPLLIADVANREQSVSDLSEEDLNAVRKMEKQAVMKQNVAWVTRMANPLEDAFLERMTLFWHGHFACRILIGELAVAQLNTIRQYALGNFKDLLLGITKDVAMIRYLNNQQNKKKSPNENFARELLELFTIGRGNYAEQDIKEAARAFTGWSSDFDNEFMLRLNQHDYGTKTFMGKTGNFDGEDIINIILEQEATALFLTTKIYRYFVNENIDNQRVKQLAKQFYQSNYDIAQLMRTIFEAEWFYAPENIGTKIKSPVELLAGAMRTLDVEFFTPFPILKIEKTLGQILFDPPNVAGWKGGRAWIDNSTLMVRLNIANSFVALSEKRAMVIPNEEDETMEDMAESRLEKFGRMTMNVQPIIQYLENQDKTTVFQTLTDFLLQPKLKWSQKTFDPYVSHQTSENYIKTLTLRIMSLPEYQLC